jgi:hypothetical protein
MLDLLASNDQFAWVSNILNRNPSKPQLSLLNRIYDLPLCGLYLYQNKGKIYNKREIPFPVEPWNFWEHYLLNFSWPRRGGAPRRHTKFDITKKECFRIQKVIECIGKYSKKKRFLSKFSIKFVLTSTKSLLRK